MTVLWVAMAFVAGALPFSLWLGRLAARADVRRVGDGNPGAANAWRVGGWRVGLPALLLDYAKGAIPVAVAHLAGGVSGWALAAVGLAPTVGHAYSPFLRFRGGKALAVTFGAWTGLMLGEGPIILGLFFAVFYLVLDNDGWAVMLGMAGLGLHLALRQAAPPLVAVWVGNTALLAWKHRHVLRRPVRVRPALLAAARFRP